ncbi:MAG: hypothetical protein R3D60_14420 [Paracoccaceae bacterium]
MKLPLILALVLAATSAQGISPASVCGVDPVTGGIVYPDTPNLTVFTVPISHRGDMVSYDWTDASGRVQGGVEHCESGQTLRYSVDAAHAEALANRLREMLNSEITYAFDDLIAEIRYSGGRARMSGSPGRCSCDLAN